MNRKTVARKLRFLGAQARLKLSESNALLPKAEVIEFDDLETFEHTKCKPLSVILATESGTRRILGFRVAQMPCNGLLAKTSRRKYGFRKDHRSVARASLFREIAPLMIEGCDIKSDESPHYPRDVKRFFPQSKHIKFLGKRGCITGQGELKKIGFDPLFSLNHTFAKLRADINRLVRRTWCTTKKPERLADHIALYVLYHNRNFAK